MLNDVDGVIIKIVEDNALSDSEVFIGIFNNWLLEICVEFKNLYFKTKFYEFHILIKNQFPLINSNFIFQFYMDKYNIIDLNRELIIRPKDASIC